MGPKGSSATDPYDRHHQQSEHKETPNSTSNDSANVQGRGL